MGMDRDKKVRREIANFNERRRMQSINAGFQGLRGLLPHQEGEKLSKAAILQQTAEYIYSLEREKTRLLSQNSQLKRLLSAAGAGMLLKEEDPSSKRKREAEADETTIQLLRERQLRIEMEGKLRTAEAELSSSRTALETMSKSNSNAKTDAGSNSSNASHSLHSSPSATSATSARSARSARSTDSPVKVEALLHSPERIVSTDSNGQRSYIVTTNNSRQNLDSIVEAIRHLEGDHLFSSSVSQDEEEIREHLVVKEEVVDHHSSSSESENTKSSSSVFVPSSSIALPSRPSPISINGSVVNSSSSNSSSNFVILKQELKSP